jgi:hypothetical protein
MPLGSGIPLMRPKESKIPKTPVSVMNIPPNTAHTRRVPHVMV